MRRRCLTLAAVLVALSAPGVSAAAPGDSHPDGISDGRFLLNCTGAMATDGRPAPDRNDPSQRIVTIAMVDLDGGRVLGFGMGMAPISVVTADTIGFGTAAVPTLTPAAEPAGADAGDDANVVEGTIDRVSGATTVILRKPGAAGNVLIAMRLECAAEPLAD